jgi:isoleucyl-tRNA synthetase
MRALGRIVANGHLYKGVKPVHWCLDCRSALAEAEVEYEEKTLRGRRAVRGGRRRSRGASAFGVEPAPGARFGPIWTTTPWTLPANEAVALHPELDYVLVYERWRAAGPTTWCSPRRWRAMPRALRREPRPRA